VSGRLPFDPKKMAAARGDAGAGGEGGTTGAGGAKDGPITVAQLAGLLEQAVSRVARPLKVLGEVSNFTDRTHWYFSLKDADAVVSCVMFKSSAVRAGFVPTVGQQVVVGGYCEYYRPQGRVTFRCDSIEPVGAGALELALRKLIEEVRGLGWLDASRKRALPFFPRRIAVVTSRTGAALQDVLNTVQRRCPGIEVCLVDTIVQGADAAPRVAGAINWVSANAERLGIDVVIVTRGGGSMEDLWAFNDRAVAEAIVRCAVPVAAAIGHESDTTLAELVADERCATPTQAAMRCTPDREELREQVGALADRLRQGMSAELRRARERAINEARHLVAAVRQAGAAAGTRVERLSARLETHKPAAVYERRRARLDEAERALTRVLRERVAGIDLDERQAGLDAALAGLVRRSAERLEGARRQLELVGPQSVLSRGYSVTFGPDGKAIRSAGAVRGGDGLVTRLADGRVESVVRGEGVADPVPRATPMPAVNVPSARPTRRGRRGRGMAEDGPGLFG
jgi:exodeoxyribonuclease VII large subunit